MLSEEVKNIKKNKVTYSFFKIISGSDLSKRRLPLMYIESPASGPVIWLTACMHGDELGGTVIIHEIFKKLKNKLLKGKVFAFPMMNPFGFETSSRYIPISNEDLNRLFPGNKNGTLGQRIAALIFDKITETQPDLVLDLHNDWRKSIPYVVLDPPTVLAENVLHEKINKYAFVSGLPVIMDTDELKGTLSANLLDQSIPALTLEMGESYVVNEKNIEYGINVIWNLLSYLGMTSQAGEVFRYPLSNDFNTKILNYASHPWSSSSGIIRFLAKPGDIVKVNQPFARICNAFGKQQETLKVKKTSLVLGHNDYSVAFPGTPVMAFGEL